MKNFLFPILLSFFAQISFAQNCQVAILANQLSNGVYNLTCIDSLGAPIVSYAWSTGATTSSIQISSAGNYCVTTTDANGCTGTDCYEWTITGNCGVEFHVITDSVTGQPMNYATGYPYFTGPWTFVWSNGDVGPTTPYVAGETLCVTATNPAGCIGDTCVSAQNCSAWINSSFAGSAPLTAHSWSSGNISYLWSTGETTQEIYPPATGYYCVTITDATGCSISDCLWYTDSIPLTCGIYMVGLHGTNGLYQIAPVSYDPNVPMVSYTWSNGSHFEVLNVDEPGEYCVTATNAQGCTATGCYTVCGIDSAFVNISIGGDSMLINFPAEVYVIQYDTVQGGILTGIDTLLTDANGQLLITDLPDGPFLLKAALLPGSPLYDNYLPTYFPNSIFWSGATPLLPLSTLHWSGECAIPSYYIDLVPGLNPGGPGFVGGLVNQGANFQGHNNGAESGEGDPMAGVNVILTLPDGTPVAATVTNAQGGYSFEGLAWGTYVVTLDIPGLPLVYATVTIGPNQPSSGNIDFKVDENSAALSATDLSKKQWIKVSPNPAQDFVLVETPSHADFRLYDAQGRIVLNTSGNGQQTLIPIGHLPAGVYFLEARAGKSVEVVKILKQ